MYLFCYGSNTNSSHLKKHIKYKNVGNGKLDNYKLVFNHFGFFANIEKKRNSSVEGLIIEINEKNLKKIQRKEFMYKIDTVNVIRNNKKYICKVFKSLVGISEIGVLPYYAKLIKDGYKENNIKVPNMKVLNYKLFKIIINTIGFLFGLYLYVYSKFKKIGATLFIVDLSMVLDQLLNNEKFYDNISNKYPILFFILYKIIPALIMAPYLILKSGKGLIKTASIVFLFFDIIFLIKYFLEFMNR